MAAFRRGQHVEVRFGDETIEGIVVEVRDEPMDRRRVVVQPHDEDVEIDVDEQRVTAASGRTCPACGADLTDGPAYRCPECGRDLVDDAE
ncbi:hypothetical protein ACFQH6_11000 [Halobacteriaceae archaeon GCM10025711]